MPVRWNTGVPGQECLYLDLQYPVTTPDADPAWAHGTVASVGNDGVFTVKNAYGGMIAGLTPERVRFNAAGGPDTGEI
jgi:hypothetical protein